MIVGISGYKSTGKDTAGSVLIDNFGWNRMSFAKPIKDLVSSTFALDRFMLEGSDCKMRTIREDKISELFNYSPRQLLQIVGTGFRDLIHPDVWVKIVEREYLNQDKHIVITDVRFPNEIAMIRKYGFVVRINRPGFDGDQHISERALDNFVFDYDVTNDDLIHHFKNKMDALFRCKVGPYWNGNK